MPENFYLWIVFPIDQVLRGPEVLKTSNAHTTLVANSLESLLRKLYCVVILFYSVNFISLEDHSLPPHNIKEIKREKIEEKVCTNIL